MRRGGAVLIFIFCFLLKTNAQDSVVTAAAGIEFVKIKPGEFLYGKYDPPYPVPDTNPNKEKNLTAKDYACAKKLAEKDALPGFIVKIDRPYYIGKFEVTQEQWEKVMGTNPSVFRGNHLPVQKITWEDAQVFLKKLNELDSLRRYRLPTEFEWEYAARAGATEDIAWEQIRLQSQMGARSPGTVGQKKPNEWGLYDMIGNVWEWMQDVYNHKMFADPVPPKSGSQHVLKGASFTGDVKNATYMTHAAGPGNGWDVGFRVVMEDKKMKDKKVAEKMSSEKLVAGDSPVPGWHISRTTHQGTTPDIRVKKNVITLKQHPYGQGGVLLTDKKYRNFELTVDVKIDSFCNGGIFLRSTESGQAYQIELSEPGGTGSLFGEMLKISRPAEAKGRAKVWKANDWNNFRIKMTGDVPRIILWINGVLMWDVTQPENDFIAGATEGMIGLQVHWSTTYSAAAKAFDMSGSWRPGGSHRFRNLRIRAIE